MTDEGTTQENMNLAVPNNGENNALRNEALTGALQNARDELVLFTGKKAMIEETLRNIDLHHEAITKIADIVKSKPRKLKPDYEYEEDDEFWKYKAEIEQINLWQQRNRLKLDKETAQLQLKTADREIERLTKAISDYEKALAE